MKLDNRYADHFTDYSSYLGRALRLLKYMHGMISFGKLFADELTECLLEAGFIKYQCYLSIYYKYAPYGTRIVVLSHVDNCIYWYTSEAPGKWFAVNLGKIFHMNFLGYVHWFRSIMIYHMNEHNFQ